MPTPDKNKLPSDKLFQWPTREEVAVREAELYEARERAKKSVLILTDKDKRLLKAMKVAY